MQVHNVELSFTALAGLADAMAKGVLPLKSPEARKKLRSWREEYKAPDMRDWYGGEGPEGVAKLLQLGDRERAHEARAVMDAPLMFAAAGKAFQSAVMGGSPIVGAAVGGSPLSMRRMVPSDIHTRRLVCNATAVCSIPGDVLAKRGIASLSIAQGMAGQGPAELFMMSFGNGGPQVVNILIQVGLAPWDVSLLMAMCGHPAVARGVLQVLKYEYFFEAFGVELPHGIPMDSDEMELVKAIFPDWDEAYHLLVPLLTSSQWSGPIRENPVEAVIAHSKALETLRGLSPDQ